jgi:hypothetical protein
LTFFPLKKATTWGEAILSNKTLRKEERKAPPTKAPAMVSPLCKVTKEE